MLHVVENSVYTFSKENKPEKTVNQGELILFKTMDCFANQISSEDQLVHEIDFSLANPASGPVYINGAEVGDVLVVDILDIKVNDVGFACTISGLGPMSEGSEVRTKLFNIKDGYTELNGVKWAINPMVGVIGTAPKEGSIPCGYPGDHGGNMDSKIITKGVRLYFPVRVKGALLQIGDLHASMGDGELSGTGIEIAGEVLVNTKLIKNFSLNWPVTETKDRYYVNTEALVYDDAVKLATEEMFRLMQPVYNWDKADTSIYFSVQGDIEVNQSTRPAPKDNDVGLTLRFSIPKTSNKSRLIK